MVITYHGESFVKVQHGDLAVAWNSDGLNQMKIGGRDAFIVEGPGEYEVANVFVRGFGVAGPGGKFNTVYTLALDGLRLAHLGTLGEAKLPESVTSELGEIDVLFVPLSATGELTPAEAYRLASTLAPKLIIPLTNSEPAIKQFMKEAGSEGVKPVDKLVLKKKDVAEKEGEIVLLSAI